MLEVEYELLLFAVKCNSHSQTLVNTTAKIQTIFQTAPKKGFFSKNTLSE